jgi:hypothetical protein
MATMIERKQFLISGFTRNTQDENYPQGRFEAE